MIGGPAGSKKVVLSVQNCKVVQNSQRLVALIATLQLPRRTGKLYISSFIGMQQRPRYHQSRDVVVTSSVSQPLSHQDVTLCLVITPL